MSVEIDSVATCLKTNFPNFKIDPDILDLNYMIAGSFAHYLLRCYLDSDTIELSRGFEFIESLYSQENVKHNELATIGFLEAIQNVWSNHGLKPETVFLQLGPLSKKWWIELNRFWNHETKFVGETSNS